MKLETFQNKNYKPGTNFLKRLVWFALNAMVFNSYFFPIYRIKVKLLQLFGSKIGTGVVIKPKVNIKYPWRLTIGDNVWIGEGVWIDNLSHITIGNNVCISQGVLLLTGNHNYKKESFDLITKPINIKSEVWIGAKSTVCPGVICEKGSVLSVGSVITQRMSEDYIYQGVPAVKKRLRY